MSAQTFLQRLRTLTLALHGGLIVALFAMVIGRGSGAHLVLAFLSVLPLLLPLPGLLRSRGYTASWASLIVIFYSALLLAEAYMLPSMKGALVALALVAALDFAAMMLYAKAQKRVDLGMV